MRQLLVACLLVWPDARRKVCPSTTAMAPAATGERRRRRRHDRHGAPARPRRHRRQVHDRVRLPGGARVSPGHLRHVADRARSTAAMRASARRAVLPGSQQGGFGQCGQSGGGGNGGGPGGGGGGGGFGGGPGGGAAAVVAAAAGLPIPDGGAGIFCGFIPCTSDATCTQLGCARCGAGATARRSAPRSSAVARTSEVARSSYS